MMATHHLEVEYHKEMTQLLPLEKILAGLA